MVDSSDARALANALYSLLPVDQLDDSDDCVIKKTHLIHLCCRWIVVTVCVENKYNWLIEFPVHSGRVAAYVIRTVQPTTDTESTVICGRLKINTDVSVNKRR